MAVLPSGELGTRRLVLYGPHLYRPSCPSSLSSLLRSTQPISSSTVVVPDAYLAFDVPGVPFLEPAFANAIVKGYNDDGDWREELGEKAKDADARQSTAYKQWVWDRSCTGMEFGGSLPPNLEGIAYELSEQDWPIVLSAVAAASPSTPSSLVPVHCIPYAGGDPSNPSEPFTAHIRVAKPACQAASLQPTQQYLNLVLRGAFFNTLSREYLAHLILLRPYTLSPLQKLTRTLLRLLLLPSFLIFHVPSKLFGIPAWARLERALGSVGARTLWKLEASVRGFVGSGYRNADEAKKTA
ncbi:hypothetical protein JCM1841_003070 [Sporobolomyces salmonicolor]